MENPQLIPMFPSLASLFPNGQMIDKDSFSRNRAIKRHAAAVVFVIDQLIANIQKPKLLHVLFLKVVEKHFNLKKKEMKGSYFLVCNLKILYYITERHDINMYLRRKKWLQQFIAIDDTDRRTI